MFGKLLNYFGYFKDSEYKEKYEMALNTIRSDNKMWAEQAIKDKEYSRKLEQQIGGLLDGYGWLESRDLNNNLLLTSLIMLQGQDEVTLKAEFINDIADKHLETVVEILEDGAVKLTVLTTEELEGDSPLNPSDNDEYEPI